MLAVNGGHQRKFDHHPGPIEAFTLATMRSSCLLRPIEALARTCPKLPKLAQPGDHLCYASLEKVWLQMGSRVIYLANLSFKIKLDSTNDKNRTLVSNNLMVKLEGNEILSIDGFNLFACYRDYGRQSRKSGTQ